ncbi:cytochrome c oxidase assembly protein COX20, mitochondrial [Venturia canescens]|uniref:cytochrome c oxidase assembly protein COX20, mitochondrial n=1 Tax=Venturia canescens TaxID=32260 RepID=UPI001C9C0E21|nr:cytochrome c oxidase assembly protein COX20, mitochondrial [Venturia canescens]
MADEENELDRPVIVFGRDLRKIPCARDSLLYGIGSGLGGGLIVFMLTSKPRYAAHSMMGIFSCVTLSWFVVCRHRWATQKFNMGQIFSATRDQLRDDHPVKTGEKEKDIELVNV